MGWLKGNKKYHLSTLSLISPSFQGGPTIFHKGNFLKHTPDLFFLNKGVINQIGCKIIRKPDKNWAGKGEGDPQCATIYCLPPKAQMCGVAGLDKHQLQQHTHLKTDKIYDK